MKNRNWKTWLTVVAVALAALLALSGCGGKSGGKEPAAQAVVEAVAAEVPFVDTMSYVDDAQFSNFYRIDTEKIADKSMYVGTRASAEEITVIRMKDAADIQLAKDAIAERLEDQRLAFENYQPGEMVKLQGAQIYTHGAYVMLVVADDTSKAEKAFNAQF